MIILFFGQPASGKTTLADSLVKNWGFNNEKTIRIDGDAWRDLTKNNDYSKEGRINNLKGAFNMAVFLERNGFIPVLSFVTPYTELREYLKNNSKEFVDIYLVYDEAENRGRNNFFAKDFEEPYGYSMKLNTSLIGIGECVIKVKQLLG